MTAPAEDLVEVIAPAGTAAAALKDQRHYAAGYRIGRIIELSGQTGHRPDLSLPGTLEEEVDQAFQNITVALEAAGADWSHVYLLRTYHSVPVGAEAIPRDSFELVQAAVAAYLAGRPPAWTAVGVAALAQPGMHIEIEAKAAV